MWIVTRAINDYNQDGEYFVAAYHNKPDFHTLKTLLPNESDATIGRLTRGGGRFKNSDFEWFYLREVKEGEGV